MKTFAQNLKSHREKLKLSAAELAEMAQVPASSISHFESGNRDPALQTLIRIAKALKITTDELLGLNEYQNEIVSRIEFLENEINRMKKVFYKPYANIEVDKDAIKGSLEDEEAFIKAVNERFKIQGIY